MGFLAGSMLWGALAAGIPLALHFFYRARYRPVPWGAMKFLRLAVEQTSRRLKFQELLLLLLRIFLMILLAVALARPFTCSGVTSGKRGEAVDAVFIIDTSYSMNVREGAKTRLDLAKEAALKIIDDLPPNSTVQVVTCADRAVAAGPKSPRNLDQAKLLIQNLQVASQSTDYLAGFGEATAALDRTEGATKEVYLFGDMQRGGWERQSSAVRSKCEEIKARGTLFLVRCGTPNLRNVAIVDLKPQTDIPHTGTRMPFTVIVKNTSSETVNGLTVTLKVDGQSLDKDAQPIEKLGPGETKPVTLTAKIDQAGWRVLSAEIKETQSDQLVDDNKFERVILVREKVRVLVVDGAPNDREPEKSGSYFLAHALLPVPDDFKAVYHVKPQIVRASEASPGLLSDKEVCILVNAPLGGPGSVPQDFLQRLNEFVKEGHGLLVTSGPNVAKDVYNRLLGTGGFDLLPMPVGDLYETNKEKPFFPDPNSIDLQSFLARFKLSANDPFLQLREATVLKAIGVQEPKNGEPSNAGRVLLRYNDGRAALLSKQVGDGEVLFLTTAVDKDWGFFATNITFQPFIHGALTHLIERSSLGYNRIAGEPIRWSPKDAVRNYQVIPPNGNKIRLGKPQGGANDQLALTVTDTSKAGIYTIAEEGAETGIRFAVVPDLRESETIDPLPDQQIDEMLGFAPEHLTGGADVSAKAESIRTKNEWTTWVLAALLLFMVFETAWAWYCGKAW